MRNVTGKVNEKHDTARQPDLLPHGLDLRLLLHEPRDLDTRSLGLDRHVATVARSVWRSVFLFLRAGFWRARDFDRRIFAAPNHDAAEMQDSAALGCRRCNTCAAARRCSRQMGGTHTSGTAGRA